MSEQASHAASLSTDVYKNGGSSKLITMYDGIGGVTGEQGHCLSERIVEGFCHLYCPDAFCVSLEIC